MTDAPAVRDLMLAIARCTSIPAGTTYTETPIEVAWGTAWPRLKTTTFSSQAATATAFSLMTGFLTSRSATGTPHYNDRILAFALADQSGRCAGAVMAIPAAGGKLADGPPTVFVAVDMSSASDCSADAAANLYQPGAV